VTHAKRFVPPSTTQLATIAALAERQLTAAEVEQGLRDRLTDDQIEENRELIRWFRRRYPTASQRLAYARRAYARWSKSFPR